MKNSQVKPSKIKISFLWYHLTVKAIMNRTNPQVVLKVKEKKVISTVRSEIANLPRFCRS